MDGKIRPLYIQHSAMQLTYHRRSVGYRTSRDRAKFFAAGSRGQWYDQHLESQRRSRGRSYGNQLCTSKV